MAITIKEIQSSRDVTRDQDGSTIVRRFRVYGSDNPEYLLMMGIFPAHMSPHPNVPFMFVNSVTAKLMENHKSVDVTITYKEWPLGLTPFRENWSWDIVASQETITSVKNPSYAVHYPPEANVGTAIGTDGETTEGVSVYRPAVQLTVTKLWDWIDAYGRWILESMSPSVNVDYWFDYAPGEVLFQGARVNRQSSGLIQITYSFLIRRWTPGTYIELFTGEVVPVSKRPHDYMWFRFLDVPTDTDDGTKVMKRGVESIHLAQVYEYTDFWMLGLAGPYG